MNTCANKQPLFFVPRGCCPWNPLDTIVFSRASVFVFFLMGLFFGGIFPLACTPSLDKKVTQLFNELQEYCPKGPPEPINVSSTTPTSTLLEWQAIPQADEYIIYRLSSPNEIPNVPYAKTSETSYLDLKAGDNTYYYAISSAKDGCGESSRSVVETGWTVHQWDTHKVIFNPPTQGNLMNPQVRYDQDGDSHILFVDMVSDKSDFKRYLWYAFLREDRWAYFRSGKEVLDTIGFEISNQMDSPKAHICFRTNSKIPDAAGGDPTMVQGLFYIPIDYSNQEFLTRLQSSNDDTTLSDFVKPELVDPLGTYPSMKLDSHGTPYIAYLATGKGLMVSHPTSNGWVSELVDGFETVADPFVTYIPLFSSLAIDSQDIPHIVYAADNAPKFSLSLSSGVISFLRYAYKNSSGEWVMEDLNGFGVHYPSLVLDSQDQPHVVYYYNFNEELLFDDLRYSYKTNEGWNTEILDRVGSVGMAPSLAIDARDRLKLSYYDFTSSAYKYLNQEGKGWQEEVLEIQDPYIINYSNPFQFWFYFSSIALRKGSPVIAYTFQDSPTSQGIKLAKQDASGWDIETFGDAGNDILHSSIQVNDYGCYIGYHTDYEVRGAINTKLSTDPTNWVITEIGEGLNLLDDYLIQTPTQQDALGRFHLVFLNLQDYSLVHQTIDLNPASNEATADASQSTLPVAGMWQNFVIDEEGTLHLTFVSFQDNYLYYYQKPVTGEPVSSPITDLSVLKMFPSIDVDSKHMPGVAVFYLGEKLNYCKLDASNHWEITQIADVGAFPILHYDKNDVPYVAYYDYTFTGTSVNIIYAHLEGETWTKQVIDTVSYESIFELRYISFIFDEKDVPHICYYKQIDNNLYYATFSDNRWKVEPVVTEGDVGKANSISVFKDTIYLSYYNETFDDLFLAISR